MTDDTPEKPKTRDLRSRLGRKSQVPASTDPEDGVAPPPADVVGPGGIAPPPNFIGKPERKSAVPFATTTAQQASPQQVKIVVDEQAMEEHSAHRDKRARRTMLMAGTVAGLIGLAIGYMVATQLIKRSTYNRAVADGKSIRGAVVEASNTVAEAKALLDRSISAAKDRAGESPKVDYEAIEKLRALPLPFSAKDFHGKSYTQMSAEIVNTLFGYNQQLGELWDQFDRLGQRTLPAPRRQELDAAAQDTGAATSKLTGCVPTVAEGAVRCGLVFAELVEPTEKEPNPTKAKVRASRGGKSVLKEIYRGQSLQNGASDYVILTNPQQSGGVLGQQKNAFSEYRRTLRQLSEQMEQTMRSQGKLETELGAIASLSKL